jgi:queuine tRNA-ribosyltransferase
MGTTKPFSYCTGSCYKDLRQQSAEYIANSNQVETPLRNQKKCMLWLRGGFFAEDKPRYLMVEPSINILENIALGDMFDCVMPTVMPETDAIY